MKTPIDMQKSSYSGVILLTLLYLVYLPAGCSDSPTDSGVGNGDNDVTEVVMEGRSFNPQSIEVVPGTTVTWVNESSETHTVTSGSNREHDGDFDSGNVASGEEYLYTFTDTGSYDYYCIPHIGMEATVVVTDNAGNNGSGNGNGSGY